MLKYIDNQFNQSSVKVKLELYLLPLLMIYLITFIYMDVEYPTKTTKIANISRQENFSPKTKTPNRKDQKKIF